MMSLRGEGEARFSMFFNMSLELPAKFENGLTLPSFFDDDFPGWDDDFGDGTVLLDFPDNSPDDEDFWNISFCDELLLEDDEDFFEAGPEFTPGLRPVCFGDFDPFDAFVLLKVILMPSLPLDLIWYSPVFFSSPGVDIASLISDFSLLITALSEFFRFAELAPLRRLCGDGSGDGTV